MEHAANSLPGPGSNQWIWIPAVLFVALCWPLICCCCLVLGAAGLLIGPPQSNFTPVPQIVPTVATVPAVPAGLDPAADPLHGPVRLQRGFSPDPYRVEVTAGGRVDTTALGHDCGFTSARPTFSFSLGGGASETFLRLFFTSYGGTQAALLVHTPDGEWLCEGSGQDPLIDLPFAPSGDYAVWVGTGQAGASTTGSLSITQSMDVSP